MGITCDSGRLRRTDFALRLRDTHLPPLFAPFGLKPRGTAYRDNSTSRAAHCFAAYTQASGTTYPQLRL